MAASGDISLLHTGLCEAQTLEQIACGDRTNCVSLFVVQQLLCIQVGSVLYPQSTRCVE